MNNDKAFRIAAMKRWATDDEVIQIDSEEPVIKRAKGGAWVKGWLWVDDRDAEAESED